jgi:hypothetical protein
MTTPKHDWEFLREEWINQNLVLDLEGPYTLKMLCEDNDLSYSMVQNKSAKEGWMAMLKDRQGVGTALAKSTLKNSEIFNELKVRVRQATYGNMVQSKAALRLNEIDPKKLTVREAIDLMRLGVEMERRALAMPDHFIFAEGFGTEDEEFTSDKAREVFLEAIELLKQEDGTYAVDGDDSGESSSTDSGESPEGQS